jgi:hypothetical protein
VVEIRPRRTPDDAFIGPARGDPEVESEQNMDVVVHDRGPSDGDREDLGRFLQPSVDPDPAVVGSFPEQ